MAPTTRSTAEPISPSTIRWPNDSASAQTLRTSSGPSTTHAAPLSGPEAPELGKRSKAGRGNQGLGDVDLQDLGDMRRGEGAGRHRRSRELANAADRDPLLARQGG